MKRCMKTLILLGILLMSACGDQAQNEAEKREQAMKENKENKEHVHDENCDHDHGHDHD